MTDENNTPSEDDERVVRLGRASDEPTAHLIAQTLERAGYRARAAGFETIASQIVPGSSQFTVDVLIHEGDYEAARALIEGAPTSELAVDDKRRCVVCRYDMANPASPVCPECGTDLEALGGVRQRFIFDAPPRDPSLLKNPGALLGLIVLIALPVSCLGYAVYTLITGSA